MNTSAVQRQRVLRALPQPVYGTFLDAEAMAKWLPPNGFTARVHSTDAKVGGSWSMSFTSFLTGHSMAFGGEYLELKKTNASATPAASMTPTCTAK